MIHAHFFFVEKKVYINFNISSYFTENQVSIQSVDIHSAFEETKIFLLTRANPKSTKKSKIQRKEYQEIGSAEN